MIRTLAELLLDIVSGSLLTGALVITFLLLTSEWVQL